MDWTYRLRLRNLKMLLSLAQTRNISHSAAMLNTTQPGLSKWLKDLEEDIGLPLFERHARGLRPTSHGEALIAHAMRIDAQLDRASGDMAALREGGGGRVVIGASGASASDTVPLAVLRLLERMPQARAKLVEGTTDRLLAHTWPGNIRELENTLRRAFVLAEHDVITSRDLTLLVPDDGRDVEPPPGEWTLSAAVARSAARIERDLIDSTLEHYRGSRAATAQALGIDRKTLFRKIRQHDLRRWIEPSEPAESPRAE